MVVLPAGVLWLVLYFTSRKVAQTSAITSCCLPVIGWMCHLPWQQILYLGVMRTPICLRHVPDLRTPGEEQRSERPGRPARP